MWQRIQTFFLGMVALAMAGSTYWPLYQISAEGNTYVLYAFEVRTQVADFNYVGIFSWLSVILAALNIFLYKRRKLQLQLCGINFLMIAATFLLVIYQVKEYFEFLGQERGVYSTGMWMVVMAMLSNFFARWFIRRDQRKIEDANRLR